MKSLENASEKVGINFNGPYEFRDFRSYKGNANAVERFEDARPCWSMTSISGNP